jgi:esterase/lipase superfamily enzyme
VIRAKDFDQAVASTDDSFYQELSSLLCECREVVEQFNASIIAEDRFGSRDPTLSNTRSALDMVASLVQNLIARRGLNRVWTSASEESESAPPASGDLDSPSPRAARDDGRIYTVWYGTNRRPVDVDDRSKGYSGKREKDGGIHYGACWVAVPKSHTFGSVGSSWWKRWLTLKDDRLRVAGRLALEAVEFWEEVRRVLSECQTEERQALVYLHGYNVSFDEAAIRAAQIGFDLKVPGLTAFFSWPSRGTFDAYPADESSIEASAGSIKNFLVRLATESGAERVHIVAHSMGNRGLLGAVQRIQAEAAREAGVRFGQVILAAPDVDVDVFREWAVYYPRLADRTTLYISRRDRAVVLSRWLHGYDRVGYVPPVTVVEGIDSVEVGDIDLTVLGHGYFAEAAGVLYDMYQLIRHNEAPHSRPRLRAMLTPGGLKYWAIGS